MAVLLLVAEVGTTTQLDCAQPLPLPSMSRILHVTNFTCHKFYMSQILHVTNLVRRAGSIPLYAAFFKRVSL